MTKRMLVDATHGEETRVVVVNGNRLEELDFEIASRKQLKGNIYLAKVIRVEPSLQAAFVEYGGNRHGFLAFSEIHPDYYRIPIEDRAALLAEEERLAAAEARRFDAMGDDDEDDDRGDNAAATADSAAGEPYARMPVDTDSVSEAAAPATFVADSRFGETAGDEIPGGYIDGEVLPPVDEFGLESAITPVDNFAAPAASTDQGSVDFAHAPQPDLPDPQSGRDAGDGEDFDVFGGDEDDETPARRPRSLRSYKIQEVIKRRQILLVQVTKEERGNKGAALTTYLSLPGRYCVLMPNTGRGGGVSRKITNPADRRRLKDILSDLDIPGGMAVILRTAGLERAKPEIKRDLEYLMRLWDDIREQTLKSTAPALIYEEANLIKRAIRDVYAEDIEEVLVEGEGGFKIAQSFMKMMSPAHTGRVQLYRDQAVPLFHRYQVESQIDAIHSPVVQLRSGGYIVINPTEALVAIDVNSGRSTRERNIEETAYKTNMEAAEEVARQLRLRDLAGLIVIDFIDMEDSRNNIAVERKLKDAMKNDRARIQVGRISLFGLMELSRQRLRPSLQETNFERCPHCEGTGVVRSVESAALNVLRAIADEGIRRRAAELLVYVPTRVALYILNQKRADLSRLETRYGFRVAIANDDSLIGGDILRIERMRARTIDDDNAGLVSAERILEETDRDLAAESDGADEPAIDDGEPVEAAANGDGDDSENERRRRRRRRRRGGRDGRDGGNADLAAEAGESEGEGEGDEGAEGSEETTAEATDADGDAAANGDGNGSERRGRRRRGRRGGRRERGPRDDERAAAGPADASLADEAGDDAVDGEEAGSPGIAVATPAPVIRAVLPPAHAVQPLEPIDFDLILDGEEPVAAAPAVTVGGDVGSPQPVVTAPVATENAPVDSADAATGTDSDGDNAEAKVKKPAKPRKRKLKSDTEDAGIDAPPAVAEGAEVAKPRRSRKPKAADADSAVVVEAGDAVTPDATGDAATEETGVKAKKPAKPRKRKVKGDTEDAGVDAPPAVADIAAAADIAAEPGATEPPEPEAGEPEVGEPEADAGAAAEKPGVNVVNVTTPSANPRRGWWSR